LQYRLLRPSSPASLIAFIPIVADERKSSRSRLTVKEPWCAGTQA
jgi:hypothetical protein